MQRNTLFEQLKMHSIAIMSLIIAIVALTYTAWREEVTEKNRSTRLAAFEALKALGELQIIINHAHYQPNAPLGNPFLGWGYVALVGDMGQLLPAPIPVKTSQLTKVWGAQWEKISTDETALDEITREVDTSRSAVLEVLRSLR